MSTHQLAANLKALPGFRWIPGMLDETGARVVAVDGHRLTLATAGGGSTHRPDDGHWAPDLTDPATVSCLIHLVREAWRGWMWELGEDYTGASFEVLDPQDAASTIVSFIEEGDGALARVLVAALEAAP